MNRVQASTKQNDALTWAVALVTNPDSLNLALTAFDFGLLLIGFQPTNHRKTARYHLSLIIPETSA